MDKRHSFKKDAVPPQKEYAARKAIRLSLQWLEKEEIKNKFGFEKEAALFSRAAAEVKAYSLTHHLLHDCRLKGLRVYDHTEIIKIHEHHKGVELLTLRELALPGKARALESAFKKLFPSLDFKTDFKWAGAFASTKTAFPIYTLLTSSFVENDPPGHRREGTNVVEQ